jgi:hypothetical protein
LKDSWVSLHQASWLKPLIVQAVSCRVRAKVRSCGICDGQNGTEAGFLRVLRFPLPVLIPPTAPHKSSSIIRSWYNRPIKCPTYQMDSVSPQLAKINLKKLAGLITLPTCILEVTGLNLRRDTGYPEWCFFFRPSRLMPGCYWGLKLYHDYFLPNPFRFIIQ